MDICLVLMPYAAVERPSIALGLLKAALKENGIQSTVLYPNLWFAEEIGLYKYKEIGDGFTGNLVGEWTFSGVAFPNFEPNHSKYFQINSNIKEDTIQELWRIRKTVAAFVDRVAQSILDLQPRMVGCSSTFYQHCASLALLRRIRELAPEVMTLMGGSNCEGSMGLATHQAFPWVDFVCSGEGDELFVQLCRLLLERGRDLDVTELPYGVIGPAHRNQEPMVSAAPRALVQNLDDIPIPDYDDYFQTLQNSQIARYITPALPVETSRGCWWGQKKHCTFCGLNGKGMTYRSKSPERVVQEFRCLSQKYGHQKFIVVDNILDLRHIDTVLPILAGLEQPYSIFYETKANLKRHQVKQLAEAGVRWLQPGIESMHDSILELMNKGNTGLMNVQLLKWARELGIQIIWNFLVGLPGERGNWYAEMLEWLPVIVHLQPPIGVGRIRYDRFSPFHERAADYGLTIVPHRAYSYIYPLPPALLQDLVYSFESTQVSQESKQLEGYPENQGVLPEHQVLQEWVAQWRQMFESEQPPMLSIVEDDGKQMKLIDTRPCAIEPEIDLAGLAYQVYVECDRVLTHRELMDNVGNKSGNKVSWDEIQPVVAQLRSHKILLELNGRLLSLAVREPIIPLEPVTEQPGGYVDVRRYIHDTSKSFWDLFKDKLS